jgi:hypothetical protein
MVRASSSGSVLDWWIAGSALRSLLNFLDEPYFAECLAPLTKRINSSNVPADFKIGDPATDPAVVERATRLCAELFEAPQPSEASAAAVKELEAAFAERVQYVARVDSRYCRAQQIITALEKENAEREKSYHADLQRLRWNKLSGKGHITRNSKEYRRTPQS